MKQFQREITVKTTGRKLHEVTRPITAMVKESGVSTGIAHLFCPHTSASLTIQENADPDVRTDLENFFERLVPDGDPRFMHRTEGPDDMAAHVKTALTATSLAIPVADGTPALGTWQGIYLFEHRIAPHERRIIVHIMGE